MDNELNNLVNTGKFASARFVSESQQRQEQHAAISRNQQAQMNALTQYGIAQARSRQAQIRKQEVAGAIANIQSGVNEITRPVVSLLTLPEMPPAPPHALITAATRHTNPPNQAALLNQRIAKFYEEQVSKDSEVIRERQKLTELRLQRDGLQKSPDTSKKAYDAWVAVQKDVLRSVGSEDYSMTVDGTESHESWKAWRVNKYLQDINSLDRKIQQQTTLVRQEESAALAACKDYEAAFHRVVKNLCSIPGAGVELDEAQLTAQKQMPSRGDFYAIKAANELALMEHPLASSAAGAIMLDGARLAPEWFDWQITSANPLPDEATIYFPQIMEARLQDLAEAKALNLNGKIQSGVALAKVGASAASFGQASSGVAVLEVAVKQIDFDGKNITSCQEKVDQTLVQWQTATNHASGANEDKLKQGYAQINAVFGRYEDPTNTEQNREFIRRNREALKTQLENVRAHKNNSCKPRN